MSSGSNRPKPVRHNSGRYGIAPIPLAAWLCAAIATVVSGVAAETIVVEAEEARVVAPAMVLAVEDARGGRAVRINDDTSLVRMNIRDSVDPLHSAVSAERGEIGFAFRTAQAGEYTVWVRLQWHCPCSPYLNVRTSGRYLGRPGDEVSTGLLTTSVRPLVWHWANAGAYAFDAGEQEVRLVQRGHLSVIDALAVSSEAGYRPPGFQDLAEEFNMAGPLETWARPVSGETVVQPFSDREWTDFSLEVAFPIDEAQRQFEVEFCGRDDAGYRLVCEGAGEGLRAALIKRAGGTDAPLAEHVRTDAGDPWHVARIERVRKTIEVSLDGVSAISVEDDSFVSGRCGVCMAGARAPRFQDVAIRPVKLYEDYFTGDAANWRPFAGSWRVVSEAGSPCYVGHSAERALSVAPWRVDGPYRLAASVRVLDAGRAGVAFDITDADDYSALTICGRESGESELQVVAVENGSVRVVWSQVSSLSVGQWVFLEVEKEGRIAFIFLERAFVAAVELRGECVEGSVGFVAGSGGSAQFASAHCRETADVRRYAYVFEPPGARGALAQWREEAGRFALHEHPGRLDIARSRDARDARLSWRVAVDSPLDVEVFVRPAVDDTPRPRAESLTPDLPMPVFPDDARFGIAFTPEDAPEKEVRISVDLLQMRNLEVRRGPAVLFNETAVSPAESAARVIAVRLDLSKIAASVGDRLEGAVPLGAETIRGTLALIAENLGDAPVQVTRILIRKRPVNLVRYGEGER